MLWIALGALEFAKRFWAALIYNDVDIKRDESALAAGGSADVIDATALNDAA